MDEPTLDFESGLQNLAAILFALSNSSRRHWAFGGLSFNRDIPNEFDD